jgi:uncharacterized protein (DUF342 family)
MTKSSNNGIHVSVAGDAMSASVTLSSDFNADTSPAHVVRAALEERGVCITSQVVQRIEELVAAWQEDPETTIKRDVAVGEPPKHGRDGRIVFEERFAELERRFIRPADDEADVVHVGEEGPDETDAPEGDDEEEHKAVNFYEQSALLTVEEGDRIATIVEPDAGVDGVNVNGKMLACRDGKPFKLNHDASIDVGPDGAVIALQPGMLTEDGGRLRIVNELFIRDYVDFSTGNIDFRGDVSINKGIRDGFRVAVVGNLSVNGLVEAASIVVDGDAELRRGMAGREKGDFDVSGNLHAHYLDSVTGRTGKDLLVDRELVNSQVRIGGKLIAPNATIFGGAIAVAGEGEVKVLGSASSGAIISIGCIPAIDEVMQEATEIRSKVEEHFETAQEKHDTYKRLAAKLTAAQAEELTELVFNLSAASDRLKKLDSRMEMLNSLVAAISSVDLLVQGVINAKTELHVRGRTFRFRTDVKGPVRIRLTETGQPVLEDVTSGQMTPITQYATEQGVEDEPLRAAG